MITPSIIVESGSPILPAFQAAKAAIESAQIRPGVGSRLSLTPIGYSVSAPRWGNSFQHPWKPMLRGGLAIVLSKGIVNGFVPVIRQGKTGIPMDGGDSGERPALALDAKDINRERQESWVCVEVTADEDGELTEESPIEIVHRSQPYSVDPKIGRHPLVHLLWLNERPGIAFPVCHFNLRYVRTESGEEKRVRHFFL